MAILINDTNGIPAVIEQPGSLRTQQSKSGSRGYREFWCRYDYMDGDWKPVLHTTSFSTSATVSGTWRDDLICVSISEDPVQNTVGISELAAFGEYEWYEVKAEYSTLLVTANTWKVNWAGGGQMMNLGEGRIYDDCGYPCTAPLAIPVPEIGLACSKLYPKSSYYLSGIMSNLYKINDNSLTLDGFTFAAGTLLLEGWSAQEYNTATETITLAMKFNPRGHNYTFRQPIQDRDVNGLRWNGPTPIWVSGTYPGAWTTTTPRFFEAGDFNNMLGLL